MLIERKRKQIDKKMKLHTKDGGIQNEVIRMFAIYNYIFEVEGIC